MNIKFTLFFLKHRHSQECVGASIITSWGSQLWGKLIQSHKTCRNKKPPVACGQWLMSQFIQLHLTERPTYAETFTGIVGRTHHALQERSHWGVIHLYFCPNNHFTNDFLQSRQQEHCWFNTSNLMHHPFADQKITVKRKQHMFCPS